MLLSREAEEAAAEKTAAEDEEAKEEEAEEGFGRRRLAGLSYSQWIL